LGERRAAATDIDETGLQGMEVGFYGRAFEMAFHWSDGRIGWFHYIQLVTA
jgi:hypothetical protein